MPRDKRMRKLQKKNKRREERLRLARQRSPEALLGRARQRLGGKKSIAVVTPPDGVKMSEIMEDFIAPYGNDAMTIEDYRALITVGMMAWDVALLPENERDAKLEEMIAQLPPSVGADMRMLVHDMIERKDKLFSQYRRFLLDFELSDVGDGWRLFVVSIPTDV